MLAVLKCVVYVQVCYWFSCVLLGMCLRSVDCWLSFANE